ncbi:hypothetical protein D3C86_1675590 [compost metagenome]
MAERLRSLRERRSGAASRGSGRKLNPAASQTGTKVAAMAGSAARMVRISRVRRGAFWVLWTEIERTVEVIWLLTATLRAWAPGARQGTTVRNEVVAQAGMRAFESRTMRPALRSSP